MTVETKAADPGSLISPGNRHVHDLSTIPQIYRRQYR